MLLSIIVLNALKEQKLSQNMKMIQKLLLSESTRILKE
jgi:hypothetical protein